MNNCALYDLIFLGLVFKPSGPKREDRRLPEGHSKAVDLAQGSESGIMADWRY